MKKNAKRIGVLVLVFLLLLTLDISALKKYISFSKVKYWIEEDYNFYKISKSFFGEELNFFYNGDAQVSGNIIDIICQNGYNYVYQSNDTLYLNDFGVVSKIKKIDDYYEVTIVGDDKKLTYGMLKEVMVNVYDKIDTDTLIGYIDYSEVGYLYYYYQN